MTTSRPIGIFDSGVGGLSVARSIRQILPTENLIYVADQEFSPYGIKSQQIIKSRADTIGAFLHSKDCKAIVVACNTATVNAIDRLRKRYEIPIIGVEPAIKPAALRSTSKVVGVLATEKTLSSIAFNNLKSRFSEQVDIEVTACPRLVELVESHNLNSNEASKVVESYVLPLLSKGADHIVLGCTHFSFLLPAIEKVVRGRASIIDTANPVAVQLKRRLSENGLLNSGGSMGEVEFWSSDHSKNVPNRISQLWGGMVDVYKL